MSMTSLVTEKLCAHGIANTYDCCFRECISRSNAKSNAKQKSDVLTPQKHSNCRDDRLSYSMIVLEDIQTIYH